MRITKKEEDLNTLTSHQCKGAEPSLSITLTTRITLKLFIKPTEQAKALISSSKDLSACTKKYFVAASHWI